MNTKKIIQYVHQCRWCDFKEEIEKSQVSRLELTALPFDDNKKAFVVGTVKFHDDRANKFFSMPLAIKETAPSENISFIEDNGKFYTDALIEPDFWQSFSKFLNQNNGQIVFPNGLILENTTFGATNMFEELATEESKALGVEQSNTTLKIGNGKLAFKLERMLDFIPEINSELEVNEKLMRENATFMPKSFGGLVWRTQDGRQSAGGIVQEFVTNKGDMWNYLQSLIQNKLEQNYLSQTDLTPQNNPEIMSLISTLHKRTSEMGEVLSRPDENPSFSPKAVDTTFIRNYEFNLSVLLNQTKNTIKENLNKLPLDIRRTTENMLNNWDELTSNFVNPKLEKIKSLEDKGTINRVHGDYHLGQVMVTPENDIKVIDFGGEPGLPIKERKQKYISIRDIAGMYRSIKGYLGAVAVEDFAKKATTPEAVSARKSWGQKAIKPLIKEATSTFLGEHKVSDPWLSLEILRKNLYEVKYEVAERPEMAYVPIQGLTELFAQTQSQHANENIKSSFDKAE